MAENDEKKEELINQALNDALYYKMKAEQEEKRRWLLSQSPEMILNNSYLYHIQEDIVLALDANNLDSVTAATLLECESPLGLAAKTFIDDGANLDLYTDALVEAAKKVQAEETQTQMSGGPIYYPLEEQINDCYAFLEIPHKAVPEMDEAELEEAKSFLSRHFVWAEKKGYIQAAPRHRETGTDIAEWADSVEEDRITKFINRQGEGQAIPLTQRETDLIAVYEDILRLPDSQCLTDQEEGTLRFFFRPDTSTAEVEKRLTAALKIAGLTREKLNTDPEYSYSGHIREAFCRGLEARQGSSACQNEISM